MTEPAQGPETAAAGAPAPRRRTPLWQKLVPWAITVACFSYLYVRLAGAAARQGQSALGYLGGVFAEVSWTSWLALMIPYSVFFFLVDSTVVWRVVNWFNTRVALKDILPIRGSSYILSIVNEQVGKGAMGLYLYQRHGVPGWEVGSSMIFIMFCEFYYLLSWATLGWMLSRDQLPAEFEAIPYILAGALVFFVVFHLFFTGVIPIGAALRDRPLFKSFREASVGRYLTIIVLRSPAIALAVVVYTLALRLFGPQIDMATMLGYLPVIFFGAATPGPMRSVAITLWVVLFPGEDPARMTAFGIVQHNFFIFFNAAIGLLFLRRANRELFGEDAAPAVAGR
ncbi:MAG: hypothetical protein ACQGVK_13150 [Myxococcota bacterium]